MRTPLTISLLLNLVLLGAILYARQSPAGRGTERAVPADLTNRQLRLPVPAAATPAPAEPVILEVVEPFHWAHVESTDYRVYMTNLLAIGCPASTVEHIIRADVKELFDRKVADAVSVETANFWTLMTDREKFQEVVEEKVKVLDKLREEQKDLLEALGEGFPADAGTSQNPSQISRQVTLDSQMDFLSAEKRGRVIAALDEHAADIAQLNSVTNLTRDQRRAAELELRVAHTNALTAFLSPDELQEYKLRTSPNADRLRRLVGFEASAEEVRQLVEIEDRFAGKPDLKKQALESALGPDRLSAYQRSQDGRFQAAYQYTSRSGLPEESAVQLFALQQQHERERDLIRRDKSLSPEAQRAANEAVSANSRAELTNLLGPHAPRYLERNSWFD